MAEDHRRLVEEMAQGTLLDDPDFLKEIVERVLQEILEAEMTEHLGAAPYERSEGRKGHRNGYNRRTLRTRVGTLNLLVPQDREGTFSTRLFSRYQRNEKARVGQRVVSQGVLIVSAVRDEGLREIVAVAVADTESEATYQELFRSLRRRGLRGVELVTSDDHEGLKAAISRHFQGASWQRCQVHYARNLTGMVGIAKRKELAAGLRGVFAAATREQALRSVQELADAWRVSHPQVAEHLEEHIEECLTCLAFPEPHRKRIRTTNGQERLNQEIKRRTRVVRIFPNREACLRLVTALAVEQSEEWLTGRRYLDMRELEERRWEEERRPEEVMLMER